MTRRPALLFVYNADSGLFNTMADIGHKVFSPETYQCALCALTHGYFSERKAWREFVERMPCTCEFLHRDEFLVRHPGVSTRLPAVFQMDEGEPCCCLDADTLEACTDLEQLQQALRQQCCPGTDDVDG